MWCLNIVIGWTKIGLIKLNVRFTPDKNKYNMKYIMERLFFHSFAVVTLFLIMYSVNEYINEGDTIKAITFALINIVCFFIGSYLKKNTK